MKKETVNRLILVLEITAVILFHSLKSAPAPDKIVAGINESTITILQKPSELVVLQNGK